MTHNWRRDMAWHHWGCDLDLVSRPGLGMDSSLHVATWSLVSRPTGGAWAPSAHYAHDPSVLCIVWVTVYGHCSLTLFIKKNIYDPWVLGRHMYYNNVSCS